jgi:integrase
MKTDLTKELTGNCRVRTETPIKVVKVTKPTHENFSGSTGFCHIFLISEDRKGKMGSGQRRLHGVAKVVHRRKKALPKRSRAPAPKSTRRRLPSDLEIPIDLSLLEIAEDALAEETKPQGNKRYTTCMNLHRRLVARRQEERDEHPEDEELWYHRCRCVGNSHDQKLHCICTALKMFYGFYERDAKSYGTIGTYLDQINTWRKQMGDVWTKWEVEGYLHLKHVADVKYAMAKTASAVAITSSKCNQIIDTLYEAGEEAAANGLYLMAVSGGRWDDLFNLAAKDMTITKSRAGDYTVLLHFRIGKTREETGHAHLSAESSADCLVRVPKRFHKFAGTAQRLKAAGLGIFRPFAGLTTDYVGSVLRAHNCGATTYSFRKHFAARVQAEHPHDLAKVSERLGHRNLNMAKAYYLDVENSEVFDEYRRHLKLKERN